MPSPVQAFFEHAFAEGLSVQEIYEEARARLPTADSLLELSDPDSTDTLLIGGASLSGPEETTQSDPLDSPLSGLPRYTGLGLLGRGGMGEIWRVQDKLLGRTLAMKIIHSLAMNRAPLVARFREEAQATAQLQHPGIVPIYDLGQLPDGRLWFTMQEVSGHTFGEVIEAVHHHSDSSWGTTPDGWTLHRLVDTLRRVCEAVAYAHSRGVLHRDLKPNNLMVGRHGEALVLDWGLAKVLGASTEPDSGMPPIQTRRSSGSQHLTVVGHIAGTPAYMSPEQAEGLGDAVTTKSDVYSLGAILYQLLSGRAPYTGNSASAVLGQVRRGPPASLTGAADPLDSIGFGLLPELRPRPASGPPLPPALVAACEHAMARAPSERLASAAALARALQSWLDGSTRLEAARAVAERARSRAPEAQRLRAKATILRAEAAAMLEGVDAWRPEEAKAPAWELEDEADALEGRAELMALEEEQLLQGALTHAPNLVDAHAALAQRYRADHAAAEAARTDATRAEALFRRHLLALPNDHPDRASHATYLEGVGALTLLTDPPGAEVVLEKFTRARRREIAVPMGTLGTTPLHGVPLPRGSYRLRLRAPGCVETRYPVHIRRGEHWDGCPPGEGHPRPIRLPRVGELEADDCYVPAGWYAAGGDRELPSSLPARRLWVDGFILRRFPVTNGEYLNFLNDLMEQGREADALAWAPRERAAQSGQVGQLVYGRTPQGRFELVPDPEGDLLEPDWPVFMVTWTCAAAYARWEAARTGKPWALPAELAWEKAARGVDGRIYPWGGYADPSWALSRESHPGRGLPTGVHSHPVDESVYGVRGMGGNIRDWCGGLHLPAPPADRSRIEPVPSLDLSAPVRSVRGGSWGNSGMLLRTAYRYSSDIRLRLDCIGFRLARSAD